MTAETPRKYVSVAEACRQLDIPKSKFYELLADGEFESIKLPPYSQQARRKVAQDSIDAFVKRAAEATAARAS